MKKATFTLEIAFDEDATSSPESWDWRELLDLKPEESVTVTNYEETEE